MLPLGVIGPCRFPVGAVVVVPGFVEYEILAHVLGQRAEVFV